MTTLLEGLRIHEVSVVDDPANELPGFMLMKAARQNPDTVVAEFRKLVDEIAASDLSDDEKVVKVKQALRLAPASVRDAMEMDALVHKWLIERARENGHDVEDDQPHPVAAASGGLRLPWRHTGASLLRRR
jgi:hypothetical protein